MTTPRGVRLNADCPGWVRTPIADEELRPLRERRGLTLDEACAQIIAAVPLHLSALPVEIAAQCRFLASGKTSIMTGAVWSPMAA